MSNEQNHRHVWKYYNDWGIHHPSLLSTTNNYKHKFHHQKKNSTHEEIWRKKTKILVLTNKSSTRIYSVGGGLILIARFAFAFSADDATHTALSAGSPTI